MPLSFTRQSALLCCILALFVFFGPTISISEAKKVYRDGYRCRIDIKAGSNTYYNGKKLWKGAWHEHYAIFGRPTVLNKKSLKELQNKFSGRIVHSFSDSKIFCNEIANYMENVLLKNPGRKSVNVRKEKVYYEAP